MKHMHGTGLPLAALLAAGCTMGALSLPVRADDAPATPAATHNFYAWANWEWLEQAVIPADQPRVDNFSGLQDRVYEQLRELFAALKAANDRTPEQEKLLRLYEGFVDLKGRDARGLKAIAGELQQIRELEQHRDVALMFAHFQTIGILSPLVLAPAPDYKDSEVNIGFLAQAGLGIERDYYIGTGDDARAQRALYRNYLAKLFTLAEIPEPEAAADRAMEVETGLARIQWSRVENRNPEKLYNPLSSEAFAQRGADLFAGDLLQAWGAPAGARLNVMQPSYLEALGPYFRGTSVERWRDYLRARLLTTCAGLLDSRFKAALFEHQQALGVLKEEPPLWRDGIDFVTASANLMLGRAYVERYYDQATKDAVTKVVMSIRETYGESIRSASWMSEATRQKALEKLGKMRFKIGYPDRWRDYAKLEVPGTDLMENFRRAMQFEHARAMAKIGRPVDRNEWANAPHEVNAFYSPSGNEFILLAGILGEPFFDRKSDAATQYGGLGFVVGHEIGHGFDDQGSRFDADGNLHNWWTEADATAYGARKQKLIAQANAYEILPGTFLKGEQEIGEIMGDLSGAQIALRAYQKTPDASPKEFFVHLAQTWRSKWRPEFIKLVLQSDVHPPSEFRANGIVRQFGEFHEAFGVKPGDRMYQAPEDRVLLW